MPKKTVQIGGKIYDAESGVLLKIAKPQLDIAPARQSQSAKLPANRAKPSTTLNRQFVKAPIVTAKEAPPVIKKRATRPTFADQARAKEQALRTSSFKSRQIRHFMSLEEAKALNSKQPVVLSEITNPQLTISAEANRQFKQIIADARQTDFFTRYRMHQIASQRRKQELKALKQAERAFAGQKVAVPQISPAQAQALNIQTKQKVLAAAIANDQTERPAYQPRQSFFKRHISLIAGSLAMIVLGGYLTYLNMPNISLRIAASQAGINASYPEYKPAGYSIKKLASFENNQVVMEYQNHNKTLKLTQQASTWNSKTTLENIVKKRAGEVYHTDQTKGLTIYTYNNQATWVNGGILYNLTFDDTVSIDQIHKIATSL